MVVSNFQIEVFMLVLARILGMFIMAPLFSARSIQMMGKLAIAVWASAVLWYVVPIVPELLPTTAIGLFVALTTEVIIGFLIGFLTSIIFLGVQSAGEIMDLQMGLSVAASFDPIFGASISIIGRMCFYIALTVFLLSNGHHMLLSAIHQSFTVFPPGSPINLTSPMLVTQMMSMFTMFWTIAIQLAGPIVLMIFLCDFAFGIVSRVAPQVNVFQLGFQVKPSLGLIGLLFTLPLLAKHVSALLGTMLEQIYKLLSALRI